MITCYGENNQGAAEYSNGISVFSYWCILYNGLIYPTIKLSMSTYTKHYANDCKNLT